MKDEGGSSMMLSFQGWGIWSNCNRNIGGETYVEMKNAIWRTLNIEESVGYPSGDV